jgi:hypothetical protein
MKSPWTSRGNSDPFWDEAIKRRADSLAAASNATEDQAPLLRAPLRVFIYDAMERGARCTKHGKTMGKPWENHRKMGISHDFTENGALRKKHRGIWWDLQLDG